MLSSLYAYADETVRLHERCETDPHSYISQLKQLQKRKSEKNSGLNGTDSNP